MARRSTLRASDSDRESVAERLRAAAGEGRLVAEEFEERLASALRARTYGELDALIADLPAPRVPGRRGSVVRSGPRSLARLGPAPAVALVLLLPLVVALVMAVVAIVFAMVTAWAMFAALVWLTLGHGRRWYGPRWSHARHGMGPPRGGSRPGVYRARPGFWL